MLKILKIALSCLFLLVLASSIQAATPLDVVINEIAWMGTQDSYTNEWIELYNNTDETINFDGWSLKTTDGTPEINLAEIISANGFYILERTGDDVLPNISADQIYSGALNNTGENLELYDNYGDLIDQLNYSSGWFSGDNKTKQTMERKNSKLSGSDSDNWQTSKNPGGTPKAKNSEQETMDNEQLTPAENGSLLIEKVHHPTGIVLNEILPSPEGPDSENEWIEIFNQNDFEVTLSGWKISDKVGKTTTYSFPEKTVIAAGGFLVLSRPITKITLNNDSDEISLVQPDKKIIGTIVYEKAPRGESYNRTEGGWLWSPTLTPGSTNIIPSPFSITEEIRSDQEESQESIPKKEIKESLALEGLAAVGERFPESSKPLYLFLIALVLAIFSAIIILILKRKLKKFNLEKEIK